MNVKRISIKIHGKGLSQWWKKPIGSAQYQYSWNGEAEENVHETKVFVSVLCFYGYLQNSALKSYEKRLLFGWLVPRGGARAYSFMCTASVHHLMGDTLLLQILITVNSFHYSYFMEPALISSLCSRDRLKFLLALFWSHWHTVRLICCKTCKGKWKKRELQPFKVSNNPDDSILKEVLWARYRVVFLSVLTDM